MQDNNTQVCNLKVLNFLCFFLVCKFPTSARMGIIDIGIVCLRNINLVLSIKLNNICKISRKKGHWVVHFIN